MEFRLNSLISICFIGLLDKLLYIFLSVQMLSELEEVIVYKLVPDSRDKIKLMWWNRLQVGCGDQSGKPFKSMLDSYTVLFKFICCLYMFISIAAGMPAHGGRLGSNSPRSVSSDHTSRRREDMVEIRFALQEK